MMKTLRAIPLGRFAPLLFLALGVLVLVTFGQEGPPPPKASAPESGPPPPAAAPGAEAPAEAIAVAPPPFTKGIFPCSGCHDDLTPNPTPRQLTRRHKEIVLKHDEQNRWCLDCHTSGNLDKLHLASGKLVDFTESYKLCGQCHGPTLRDWRAGEHGKRTGDWSGPKQYLLCANCHNPHAPRFPRVKPLPPPVRPKDIR